MITVGYDPVFLDVIVRLHDPDSSELASSFQFTPGSHYPWSSITLSPGGNGLNFAKVLSTLLHEPVHFVGKITPAVQALLESFENLRFHMVPFESSNCTVSLQTKEGEMQINSRKEALAFHELSQEQKQWFYLSPINTYYNLGLNPHAIELFIKLSSTIIQGDPLSIPFKYSVFDPSTLKDFTEWKKLEYFLFDYYLKLPGMKLISVNSEEYQLMQENINLPPPEKSFIYIIHDDKQVITRGLKEDKVSVPALSEPIQNTLGAGDAFNAGLVSSLYSRHPLKDAVTYAIKIAQKHLLTPLP